MITAERLRECLHYDPATGVFVWLVKGARRIVAGDQAGCAIEGRYTRISIDGRPYMAHRLAWLHVYGEWPTGLLDHINRDPADNRLANLRPATPAQNRANSRRPTSNTSGAKGVSWHRSRRKWRVTITVGDRHRHLGFFSDREAAAEAYRQAAVAEFGAYANAA